MNSGVFLHEPLQIETGFVTAFHATLKFTFFKDKTTIVIAHRLSTIRKADQILVVEAGHIVERGTHDQLVAKEGSYYEFYTYQAKI